MKDIDQLFADRLRHHRREPSVQAWDKLDDALDREYKPKTLWLWGRVAAALLLLIVATLVSYHALEDIRGEAQMSYELPATASGIHLPEPGLPSLSTLPQAANPEDGKHTASPVRLAVRKQGKQSSNNQVSEPTTTDSRESKKSVTSLNEGEPSIPEPLPELTGQKTLGLLAVAESLPAVNEAEPEVQGTVTLIYKPGPGQAADDKKGPLSFLSDLKNSPISLSELRNAKSALFAKVIDKKEEMLND